MDAFNIPGADRGRNWGDLGDFGIEGQEPQTRERFVETAYWNPLVVTGKDGKARVTFKAPTALSEYRITARGVTGADTLAGQTPRRSPCARASSST